MYPILGRYGPFFLYSYSVVLGLGILAGIGLASWSARQAHAPGWFDGLLVALASGLVGGRIAFVAAKWTYFQENLAASLQVWQGGLNYHGALLAGLVGLWFWCRRQRRPFVTYAGLLAPPFALTTVFGWFACWLAGCAYGRIAPHGILVADLPDSFGIFDLRYATQLIGLGLSLLVFMSVMALRRRWPKGRLFWFTLFELTLARLVVSLFRGDQILHLFGMRLDTLIEVILVVVFLILLKYAWVDELERSGDEVQNGSLTPAEPAERRKEHDEA